jgi:hypothetical protein
VVVLEHQISQKRQDELNAKHILHSKFVNMNLKTRIISSKIQAIEPARITRGKKMLSPASGSQEGFQSLDAASGLGHSRDPSFERLNLFSVSQDPAEAVDIRDEQFKGITEQEIQQAQRYLLAKAKRYEKRILSKQFQEQSLRFKKKFDSIKKYEKKLDFLDKNLIEASDQQGDRNKKLQKMFRKLRAGLGGDQSATLNLQ